MTEKRTDWTQRLVDHIAAGLVAQEGDERVPLAFNEYEVRRCGGLENIQHQYPGARIVVTPAQIPTAGSPAKEA